MNAAMQELPPGHPHLSLLGYALGSLRRRKGRSLAVAGGSAPG